MFQDFFFYKKSTKINLLYRSSHQTCSLKKVFIKNFTKIIGNTCVSVSFLMKPEACNFIKKETPTKIFSCQFCESFKNTFFTKHFKTASSFCNSSHTFILQKCFIYLFKPNLLEKLTKAHNFAIFLFCKYILYSTLRMHFTDENINTRNHVSLMR